MKRTVGSEGRHTKRAFADDARLRAGDTKRLGPHERDQRRLPAQRVKLGVVLGAALREKRKRR